MHPVKLIVTCAFFICSNVAFSQENLTYSKVDSIVASINNSKKLHNILDTGRIEQGNVKGRYRDCYVVDTVNNELKAFMGSVTLDKTLKSTVVAYYFHNSQLIKVEVGDIMGGYKKYNTTYLYYIKQAKVKDYTLQSKELKKLKYLRQSVYYFENFKKRMPN